MSGIGGDGGIVVVVRVVTTILRVAVFIRNNSLILILDGGICGVGKIENWLGPHQNWLQSAFSKMPQKRLIDAFFHLLVKLYGFKHLYCIFELKDIFG